MRLSAAAVLLDAVEREASCVFGDQDAASHGLAGFCFAAGIYVHTARQHFRQRD